MSKSSLTILKSAFLRNESGATLVEYGVALLVVIIVGGAAIGGLADAVGTELNETASAF